MTSNRWPLAIACVFIASLAMADRALAMPSMARCATLSAAETAFVEAVKTGEPSALRPYFTNDRSWSVRLLPDQNIAFFYGQRPGGARSIAEIAREPLCVVRRSVVGAKGHPVRVATFVVQGRQPGTADRWPAFLQDRYMLDYFQCAFADGARSVLLMPICGAESDNPYSSES